MNKTTLIFAPIVAAGLLFGASGSSFLKSGVPESLPEAAEYGELSDKGYALLRKEIMDPLQHLKGKPIKAEMYSRCPSGVSYYVTVSPTRDNPYYQGQVVDRMGCASRVVCFFRMDKAEEVLEAKSTEEQDYKPVAEWKKNVKQNEWLD